MTGHPPGPATEVESRPPGSRAAVARPAAVRRKVEQWLAEPDSASAIALRAQPEWSAEPVLAVRGRPVRVVACPTPLAVRAALHQRSDPELLVLLTDRTDQELGDSLLAQLSKQQVRSIDRWDLVRQVFGGARPEPRLVRSGRWAADALVDHAPADGWPAPQGSLLTRDHALGHLAARLLGLPVEQIDSAGLLQWTTDPAALIRFTSLPAELLDGLSGYLRELAGPAADPILAAVRAGQGVEVVPLGLLVGALWPAQPGDGQIATGVAVARARLEPWFGGSRLTDQPAYAYRDATEAWVDRALDSGDAGEARRMLERAETLAGQLDMTGLLTASTLLPSGLHQRLLRLAEAVRRAVPAGGGVADSAAVARAQAALAELTGHRAAAPHRVETARMAVRLLRWLASELPPAPATLHGAVHQYVHNGGWVDRARLDVFAGDPDADPALAGAYQRLHQAVDARRARQDERFARLLAAATAADSEPGELLLVEDVLERVVRPILAHRQRVLLLILDGMGVAAATELAESITAAPHWLELSPGGGARTGVLAALPTVTEVSRCSLLAGRITAGRRDAEQAAFQQRFPGAVLLHKAQLRAGAGEAIGPAARAALRDPDVPLVAAVVNTIDDALDRSEPGTAEWTTQTVRTAGQLLALATDRVVVLLSDHGHVVDRGAGAVVRSSPSSDNRWRPATDPAGDGEVLVTGRRVAKGGGSAVLAWREELRYGPRKAGYHGGAAPAEAVIPLLVFSTDEDSVPGWSGAPVASPDWWREELPQPPAPAKAIGRQRPPQAAALFELPEPEPATFPVPEPGQRTSLVGALLASEGYAQRRDTRAPLADERVAALLEVLLAGGGRATMDTLAARAGVPAHRITGTVTALRRLLQVEGYPVIEVDPDGRTVKLDQALLRQQFGLEGR